MNFEERALQFPCQGSQLYGILSLPERTLSRGILIVVGGPQYRVGSHRQFTLLARDLANHGVPVMRFDYRGMGDSEGEIRNFESVEDDIRHAIDRFVAEVPAVKELVIWGLCDAASAAVFYARHDPRICGLALLNPWVRTDESIAKTYLKHYYLARLTDRALWSKVFLGRFNYVAAVQSVYNLTYLGLVRKTKNVPMTEPDTTETRRNLAPLPERMLVGLRGFKGRVLLILSGNDLTAREFSDMVKGSREWQDLLGMSRVQRHDLQEANHTFSQREWRDQVSSWTREWLMSW